MLLQHCRSKSKHQQVINNVYLIDHKLITKTHEAKMHYNKRIYQSIIHDE